MGSQIDSAEAKIQFGLTQDFSRSGARLLTRSPFEEGAILSLSIFISETEEAECTAEVIRCKEVTDKGTWQHEVAVQMKELLDEGVVTNLVEAYIED